MGVFYLLPIFLVIAYIGSTFGNALVLVALLKRKCNSVTAEFLTAITVSGILCGSFMIPPAFATMISGGWIFGNIGCVIQAIFLSASQLANNTFMFCLALERYLVSRQSGRWKNVNTAGIVIFAVFLISCFFACFPLVFGNIFQFSKGLQHCYIKTDMLKILFGFLSYALPSIGILFLSTLSLHPITRFGQKRLSLNSTHRAPPYRLSYYEVRTISALACFNISLSTLELFSCGLKFIAERFENGWNRIHLLKWSLIVSCLACLLQPYILLGASFTLRKTIKRLFSRRSRRVSTSVFRTIDSFPDVRPREETNHFNKIPNFLKMQHGKYFRGNILRLSMVGTQKLERKTSNISVLSYNLDLKPFVKRDSFVLSPLSVADRLNVLDLSANLDKKSIESEPLVNRTSTITTLEKTDLKVQTQINSSDSKESTYLDFQSVRHDVILRPAVEKADSQEFVRRGSWSSSRTVDNLRNDSDLSANHVDGIEHLPKDSDSFCRADNKVYLRHFSDSCGHQMIVCPLDCEMAEQFIRRLNSKKRISATTVCQKQSISDLISKYKLVKQDRRRRKTLAGMSSDHIVEHWCEFNSSESSTMQQRTRKVNAIAQCKTLNYMTFR